ncbi:MAG TPA: hypothetical protein VIJ35_12435, partial [Bradyrhizobium sp.]
MSDTYLAVFVGSKTSAKMAAWNALSETERKAKEKEGIAAWKAWVEKHHAACGRGRRDDEIQRGAEGCR